MSEPLRAVACAAVLLASQASAGGPPARIARDAWGVPHVFAATEAGAAYAHGYAQAEDRLEDLLLAYRMATGRAAAVLGPELIESDVLARTVRHEEIARERYAELPHDTRALIEGFVRGVRARMLADPGSVPDWATEPQPYEVVALYRYFLWPWPWGQAMRDLRRRGSGEDDRGSNAWVVGPARTDSGGSIALIDPHLAWGPVTRFYEVGFHGGDLEFYGFAVIGTPLPAVGHNRWISLALTTGGPDTADVFELRLDPADPGRYAWDGGWREIESEQLEVAVREGSGLRVERRRVERSHHGPIVAREPGRAWAARTSYDREVGIVAQWHRIARARGLAAFQRAMRMGQSLPQNVLYADVHGNSYYLRAGRVPVRPPGHSGEAPLPGWTSEVRWRGIHPLSDLVQLANPPAGWMQNCNGGPDTIYPGSPLVPERYAPALFNTRPLRDNSRGRRARALLRDAAGFGIADAMRIATDTRVEGHERWSEALRRAAARSGASDLGDAIERLSAWNGHVEPDSTAATLFRYWMRAARRDESAVPRAEIEQGRPLDDAGQVALVESLRRAVAELLRLHGTLDVPWRAVHRARRGETEWPLAGCRADGISTLFSVRWSDPDRRGISRAEGGVVAMMVVSLDDRVRSWTAAPHGQSNDPDSPHYTDQGRLLLGRQELKPTRWLDPEPVTTISLP